MKEPYRTIRDKKRKREKERERERKHPQHLQFHQLCLNPMNLFDWIPGAARRRKSREPRRFFGKYLTSNIRLAADFRKLNGRGPANPRREMALRRPHFFVVVFDRRSPLTFSLFDRRNEMPIGEIEIIIRANKK